jgi:hypothetical protein
MTSNSYKSEKDLVNFLSKLLNRGSIALVIGSGISKPLGLPIWTELIERMFNSQKKIKYDKKKNLLKNAESIKKIVCFSKDNIFNNRVKKALYQDIKNLDYNKIKENSTILALGALTMSSRRGNIANIVTLNYDDILELYLEYNGFIVNSICDDYMLMGNEDIRIFHLHGFLPFSKNKRNSKKITLDQNDYSNLEKNSLSPLRQQILNIFRANFIIFIGVSGNDPDLEYLLNQVKTEHILQRPDYNYWGITITTSRSKKLKSFWERNNVFTKRIGNYPKDLPNLLFSICQKAAKKRNSNHYGLISSLYEILGKS